MPLSRISTSKRLLCEGWLEEGAVGAGEGLVCYPDRAYVVQPSADGKKSRVWLARGKVDGIHEHLSDLGGLLESTQVVERVESYDQLDLEERRLADGSTAKLPKGGRWFVEGPFQRSDTRNANKRVYPRSLWDKLVGDDKSYVMESVRARGMVGHLEHPGDGRTDGKQGALVITRLNLKEDGVVWGQCELLDTPNGLILQEYTRKNVRWGVSSRGNGTVRDDGTVESESYVLETWDAVMKPSVPGAYPTLSNSAKTETRGSAQGATETTIVVSESNEAVEFTALVTSLSESSIDDLDALARADLTQSLVRAMDRGSTLVSKHLLPLEQAASLQGTLTRKLMALSEAGTGSLDDAIDEVIRTTDSEGGEKRDGYDRVIESLKQRLADSVSESQELRERLEVAESRASALQGQCDEVTEQLAKVETRLAETKAELNLAEGLLATRPGARANGMVTATVDDAIRQVPDLRGFRDVLESARTPEAVMDLAERLLPTAVRRADVPLQETFVAPVVAAASRSTLPVGVVESDDSDALKAPVQATSTLPKGAQLAGAALTLVESR